MSSQISFRRKKGRKKKFVVVAVLMVLIAVAGGSYAWSQRPIPITAETFPNERLLSAVQVQLDVDDDGLLSVGERKAVSGFSYSPDSIAFHKDGDAAILSDSLVTSTSDNEQSTSQDAALSDDNLLQGLDLFDSITSMLLRDPALRHVDLFAYPSLEYLNCVASGIDELDVSSNRHLDRVFCAPDVTLKGLEASELFCTELLNHAFFSPDKDGRKPATVIYTVDYDAFGRPLEVWNTAGGSKTFAYDEAGRCISTESNRHEISQVYEYGVSGLLKKRTATYALASDSLNVMEEEYAYDVGGHMVQLTRNENGSTSTTYYDYGEGSLAASSTIGLHPETAGYAFSDTGKVEAIDTKSASSLKSKRYSYNDLGFLAGRCERSDNDTMFDLDYATSYSSQGIPLCSFKDMSRVTYVCDENYYVKGAFLDSTLSGNMFPSGLMIQAEYVKMVAPLNARSTLRYVPHFSFGLVGNEVDTFGRQWEQGTGGDLGATVIEYGPECAYGRAMGLDSPLVTNANEASLLKYDESHWLDGVVRDALPTAEPKSDVFSANIDRPRTVAGDDGHIVTNSYGIDIPDEWLSVSSIIVWPNDIAQVFYQGNPRWELLSVSICDDDEPYLLGDYSESLLAYVELGGKRINLYSPVWTMVVTEAIRAEGYQRMGKFLLLAGATELQASELMHLATGLDVTCAEIVDLSDISTMNNDLFEATERFYEQKIVPTVRFV